MLKHVARAAELSRGLVGLSPALVRQARFPSEADAALLGAASAGMDTDTYDLLLRYFATSWRVYVRPQAAQMVLPGYPSWSGKTVDGLEALARLLPLFAADAASGRGTRYRTFDGHSVAPVEDLAQILVAGTDPASPASWGPMKGRSDQRVVEAADIALSLWLLRDTVWRDLSRARRDQIAGWLSGCATMPGLENNWQLFFVLIDRVLAALGYRDAIADVPARFAAIRSFHVGDGFFRDGPEGPVDYYTAWGFHYAFHWLALIDPSFETGFIKSAARALPMPYAHLIGPDGFPIFGRSIHYRIAVSTPLVATAARHPDAFAPASARRALDATWRTFLERGAVRKGQITQGYFGWQPDLVEQYGGPGSAFWSLRALVIARHLAADHPFWTAPPATLPVENGDFEIDIPAAGWRVRGDRASGRVELEILKNDLVRRPPLEPFGRIARLRNVATGRPYRPKSSEARYGRRLYRSAPPFFEDEGTA